nr:MAG: putative RNA-dependent RNA polymerase [Mitoviridae sp.]
MEVLKAFLLLFLISPSYFTVMTLIQGIDPKYRLKNLKVAPLPPSLKAMSVKEVKRVFHFCSIMFKVNNKEMGFLLRLADRIISLQTKSGWKFTITYLAECLRIVFDLLSENPMKDGKTWVSVYANGVPKFFGMEGRSVLGTLIESKRNGLDVKSDVLRISRLLITLCALFRGMSFTHVIKFTTVTSPWTGTGYLQDHLVKSALSRMQFNHLKNRIKSPTFLWSNKSGVNARYSFLSAGLDLLAMMDRPSIWFAYLRYCIRLRYFRWSIIFILFTISLFPLYILNQLRELLLEEGALLHLGRLTVIKEMRGKARVVGITDYWTQCLFKPLHDAIYSTLGDLPEDGTNAQLRPIKLILNQKEIPPFVTSVDLSAATDRLPVIQQARILELLGLPGNLWMEILARPYNYMDEDYVYEVGQPMGAYSSFAMLALTNHVICQVAFLQAKVDYTKSSGQYAILGDDVVITIPSVSAEYEGLMRLLGVEINPIKGFRGKVFEFAKRVFHVDGTEFSPASAKVLLRSSRDPIFIPALVNDFINKGYWPILNTELSTFTKLLESHAKFGMSQWKWLFSILGPQSGFWSHFSGNEVGPRPFQLLFKEFLETIGVNFSDVLDLYKIKLSRKSHLSVRSLLDLGHSSLAVLSYSKSPWIWSAEKFEKQVKLPKPKYMAVLTTASLWNLLLPLLFYKWIKGVLRGVYFIFVDSLINTKEFMDVQLQFAMENPLLIAKLWLKEKFPRSDGNFEAAFHFELGNSPAVAANVYDSSFSNTMSGQFFNWVLSLKLQKPMQIINTRFGKATGEDDMMPVVKTSVSMLSKLHSEFRANSYMQKRLFLLEQELRQVNKTYVRLVKKAKSLGINPSPKK